jgi:hypothetical protein
VHPTRHRGASAPPGLSSYAPRRTECSAAIGAVRRETASSATRPRRAGRHRMRRQPARWKLTTTSPRLLLTSLGGLLARCQLRSRQALPRRCALPVTRGSCRCGHRVDRMLVTDRQGQAGACATAHVLAGLSRPSPARAQRSGKHTSGPLGQFPGDRLPRGLNATDQPRPQAASLNRVSLPHRVGRMHGAHARRDSVASRYRNWFWG